MEPNLKSYLLGLFTSCVALGILTSLSFSFPMCFFFFFSLECLY
jgi:hypothetical protein